MKGRKLPNLPGPPNIDRIVAAVAVVADEPEGLDKDELLADLKGATVFFREGEKLRHQPSRERHKLEKALKVTEKLDNDLGFDFRFHPHIVKLEHSLRLALAELDPKLGHRYRRALREVDPERARRLRALAKANPTKLGLRIRLAFRNPLSPWLGYSRSLGLRQSGGRLARQHLRGSLQAGAWLYKAPGSRRHQLGPRLHHHRPPIHRFRPGCACRISHR